MRGLALLIVFSGLLLMVFKRPYIGVLMWFWISLMNPHRLVYGFATSVSYAMIIAIVTLGSWVLLHPEEPKAPPRDRTTFLLAALMVWVSITSLSAGGVSDQVINTWTEAEKMLLMTLVAYAMTNTRERFDQLVLVCTLSIAYFGVRGGIFAILHGGAFRVWGPPSSMIGDNNALGVALTMILPLLFYLHHRYGQTHFKWPLRIVIGLTVLGDLFTYSRGGLLALGAMASVLWLRTRHKIVIGAAIVVAMVGVLYFAPPQWFDRMRTVQTYEEDQSANTRLWIWQTCWEMALKYPVTGAGFRWAWNWTWTNQELRDSGLAPLTQPRAPHSIWFGMLSDHGFPGLGLFIGLLVVSMVNAQWLIRRTRGSPELLWANNFGRMLQAALVGYMVGGSFVNLEMYDAFYVMVVMSAAARRLVAVELAARDPAAKAPLAGMLPLAPASASPVRMGQSLIRR
ncbi:MAG: putative O-glycosylation ligase, exosortase A system-associated [Alphaproteobacteria bacterium]